MELITLLTDKSASIEKEKEECKSQILAALNPAAAAVPGTILQSDRAMSSLQTTLVDRFLATQYTLEQSERELTIMTELVTELRGKLEREMRESASRSMICKTCTSRAGPNCQSSIQLAPAASIASCRNAQRNQSSLASRWHNK